MNYSISPIGVVHSCFKEKFGAPRQPGLAPLATGCIELFSDYSRVEAVRGLEEFSHIWIVFLFHQAFTEQWRPTVRPPRLGGNQRIGVFATRSPFRPNSLGMSVVSLESIEVLNQKLKIHVSGLDLVDGTPVIDIKPYLSYADAIPSAQSSFATDVAQSVCEIIFSDIALLQCKHYEATYPNLTKLICQLLLLDPRPGYCDGVDDVRTYGMRLYEFNVQWQVAENCVTVTAVDVAT